MRLRTRPALVVACLTIFIAMGIAKWIFADPYDDVLRALDPSLSILNDPARLLAIAANGHEASMPSDDTKLRHQALVALLSPQRRVFGTDRGAVTDGEAFDRIEVRCLSATQSEITLLATPNRTPSHVEHINSGDWHELGAPHDEPYWSVEVLRFEKPGRLISRAPWRN